MFSQAKKTARTFFWEGRKGEQAAGEEKQGGRKGWRRKKRAGGHSKTVNNAGPAYSAHGFIRPVSARKEKLQFNADASLRRYAFFASRKAQPFGRGGFDTDV